MQNAGVPAWQCEYQMGHTLSPLDKAYFLADKDKLKENYFEHLNAVMIETEIIEIDGANSEEFKKLKLDNEKLADTIKQMELMMNVIQNKLGMNISIEHKEGAPGVSSITFGPGNK